MKAMWIALSIKKYEIQLIETRNFISIIVKAMRITLSMSKYEIQLKEGHINF